MNIKSLLLGMMTCVALAACTNADLVENEGGNGVDNSTAKAYIGIRIANPQGEFSRAAEDGFEDGDANEYSITRALFVFYTDGEKPLVGTQYSDGIETNPDNITDAIEANSVAVLALNTQNEAFPNQLVAYLNVPEDVENVLKTKTLDEAMAYVAQLSDISNFSSAKNFIMTNSVYLDGSDIACATKVGRNNFAETEDAAKTNPIKVYVERLAAKVRMTTASDIKIDDIDITLGSGSKNKLKLVVDGWSLNGTNKDAFLLKNIDKSWKDETLFTNWNDPTRFRSYWGMDNNYNDGIYPNSFADYNANNSSLDYFSWNEIAKNKKAPQYCLENTMTAEVAQNVNATTHMVIAGHYVLVDENDDEVADAPTELFKYAGTFYTRDEMINVFAGAYQNKGGVWIQTSNGHEELEVTSFDLKQASEAGEAGEAQLTLKNADNTTTYYYKEGEEYKAYKDIAEIEQKAKEALGTATAFCDGLKTYFHTTIRHLNTTEGELGYLGIVRNHIYDLNLRKIEKLGHGVYDPNQDIIIEGDKKEYYVAATLKILSWKVVNQDVDL